MKFLVTWRVHEVERHNVLKAFSQMTAAADRADMGDNITLIGRWHDLVQFSGLAICETDDPAAVHTWLLNWNHAIDAEVTPVLDDEETRAIGKKNDEFIWDRACEARIWLDMHLDQKSQAINEIQGLAQNHYSQRSANPGSEETARVMGICFGVMEEPWQEVTKSLNPSGAAEGILASLDGHHRPRRTSGHPVPDCPCLLLGFASNLEVPGPNGDRRGPVYFWRTCSGGS